MTIENRPRRPRRWFDLHWNLTKQTIRTYLGAVTIGRWLLEYGSTIFRSSDFYLGVCVAIAVGLVAGLNESVRSQQTTILIAASALGAAVLVVALTALAIIATFLDDHYRAVLDEAPGGVAGALLPYGSVAVVSAFAGCVGLVGATLNPAFPTWLQAVTLALSIGSAVWAIAGTAQLVFLTLFHGQSRARLQETLAETSELLRERRGKRSA